MVCGKKGESCMAAKVESGNYSLSPKHSPIILKRHWPKTVQMSGELSVQEMSQVLKLDTLENCGGDIQSRWGGCTQIFFFGSLEPNVHANRFMLLGCCVKTPTHDNGFHCLHGNFCKVFRILCDQSPGSARMAHIALGMLMTTMTMTRMIKA